MAESRDRDNRRQADLNARAAAARLLQQLQSGRSLSELLAGDIEGISEQDYSLVKALCFGVARWWQRLDDIAGHLLERPLKARDADIRALILIGLYQLQYTRIPPHAALAETVEAARVLKKPWAAGLVNALLRRFQRQRKVLLAEADRSLVARYSHPEWLLQSLQQAWPAHWQTVVDAANCQPPMSLRKVGVLVECNLQCIHGTLKFSFANQCASQNKMSLGIMEGQSDRFQSTSYRVDIFATSQVDARQAQVNVRIFGIYYKSRFKAAMRQLPLLHFQKAFPNLQMQRRPVRSRFRGALQQF